MIGVIRLTARRAREERLPQVAGSLTFAAVLAIVPMLAAGFALFARFPAFRSVGAAIREQLLKAFLPAEIAKPVLKHLAQFTGNTSGLSLVGSLFVLVSALALLLNLETVLNRIWQVKKNRPWARRLAMYLFLLFAGPAAIGASISATSWLLATSAGLLGALKPSTTLLLATAPVLFGTVGFACLYYFVPNTRVRKRDAIVGGLLASIAFELGKRGFAFYLLKVPTYKTMYGAFAPMLLFLLWVYYSWLVTLGAALVAANMAKSGRQPARRPRGRAIESGADARAAR
jgi:membrane protein